MTKNVIFISIDALRQDRLSVYGYDRPTTPTLDALAKRSLVCHNHFSINASTMGAFPTIMNSSRPLSHGGFDHGVFNRPPSIFKQMQSSGYETYMMSTIHWVNRFFGYGDGVDNEEMLFSLGSVIGTTGALTRTSLERYNAGQISDTELLQHIAIVIESSFDRLEQFANERLARARLDKQKFRYAPFYADGFDYQRVLKTVAIHRQQYHADPIGYINAYMPVPFQATGWLTQVWHRYRQPWRLFEEVVENIRGRILAVGNPKYTFLHRQRYKRYPDANALVDHILTTTATRNSQKPFFMWTHFFDTHLPYCAGSQPSWYKNVNSHLEAVGYNSDIDPGLTFGSAPQTAQGWQDWGALYDATVHFVDSAIARLIKGLDEAGILDETLIVLCGDHGEELGENNDISHHFRLYGYNTHVPLIVTGGNVDAGEIKAFTTHMDIAPTITALTNTDAHSTWEGDSVLANDVKKRDHILMETFFGSPCDYENRPLYFAVRDDAFHFMWKERRDPTDHLSPDSHQLFDIENDPNQQHNIYDPKHPAVIKGQRLIAERMTEIPEVSDERIKAAFGNIKPDDQGIGS